MRGSIRFVMVSFVVPLSLIAPPGGGFGLLQLDADERLVSTSIELRNALSAAASGDTILLQPGTYSGGLYRDGLIGVTIRSADPFDRAVISGGTNNIQLSNAHDVTIEQLVFADANANGLNIDDGGSFDSPSSQIVIRDIEVRDVGSTGNHDGIKLSGVDHFLIDNVRVFNWGNGGSAIDMVGGHHGLIQNSLVRDEDISNSGTGIRPKGGSKDIVIRANRVELPNGQGRAIQAGGSTGTQFFRFVDGDSGYEADEIVTEGNVIVGGSSAVSWVNIDGGVFHHNYIERPAAWTGRILNENQGQAIVDTQRGEFADNVVLYNDTAGEYSTDINIGPETRADTFVFQSNQWFNVADPTAAGSRPQLPTAEVGGQYGVAPAVTSSDPIPWEFAWGTWVVLAADQPGAYHVAKPASSRIAVPSPDAQFNPRAADPFEGSWSFESVSGSSIQMTPFSPLIVVDCGRLSVCDAAADFDADGDVDGDDFLIWQGNFGTLSGAGRSEGDADGDGDVDGNDFLNWQDAFAPRSPGTGSQDSLNAVPEPATAASVVGMLWCFSRRRRRAKEVV